MRSESGGEKGSSPKDENKPRKFEIQKTIFNF